MAVTRRLTAACNVLIWEELSCADGERDLGGIAARSKGRIVGQAQVDGHRVRVGRRAGTAAAGAGGRGESNDCRRRRGAQRLGTNAGCPEGGSGTCIRNVSRGNQGSAGRREVGGRL